MFSKNTCVMLVFFFFSTGDIFFHCSSCTFFDKTMCALLTVCALNCGIWREPLCKTYTECEVVEQGYLIAFTILWVLCSPFLVHPTSPHLRLRSPSTLILSNTDSSVNIWHYSDNRICITINSSFKALFSSYVLEVYNFI